MDQSHEKWWPGNGGILGGNDEMWASGVTYQAGSGCEGRVKFAEHGIKSDWRSDCYSRCVCSEQWSQRVRVTMYLSVRSMSANFRVQQYRPGEEVPQSGIYSVRHRGHHHDHEVTCLSGEQFPHCHQCKEEVRFSLLMAAHAIRRHMHFFDRQQMLNAV